MKRLICQLLGHDWWEAVVDDYIGTRKVMVVQSRCRRCQKVRATFPTNNITGTNNVAIGVNALTNITSGLSPTTFFPYTPLNSYGNYTVLPNVLAD